MKRNKRKTTAKYLLIFTIAFIWIHSVFSAELSSDESSFVLRIFDMIFGEGAVSEFTVRKLAHFSEFALLGFEMYLYFDRYRLSAAHGLFVAFVDETIQIFNDRSPEVRDMWIDFAGVAVGALLCLIIFRIIEKKKASRKATG